MADKRLNITNLKDKKIVCLGGGIGTVNLIKGLKNYSTSITVVVSMADEGGSSGRLRRLYKIPPPGDLISCMAALAKTKNNELISRLLTYRFPGNRYGRDEDLSGHKLGNLIIVGLRDLTGSFDKAIKLFTEIFEIEGKFLPATSESISISARTTEGKIIFGEENIDLGKYNGKRILEQIFLHPEDAKAGVGVLESIKEADVIIAGPGDLYTTILPVLLIGDIKNELLKSKAKKIFIINVANKPFETKNYSAEDYVSAIKNHMGLFPFNKIIVNTNYTVKIPKKFNYSYVMVKKGTFENEISENDLIDEKFPLYHNPEKLAKAIAENI